MHPAETISQLPCPVRRSPAWRLSGSAGVFWAIVDRLTVPSRIRMDLALASRVCQWLLLLAYTCRTWSSVGITGSSAANTGSEKDETYADEPEPHFEPLSPFGETLLPD
ncbi:hypothetical protein M9X92_010934 [Pyricularia oryzae]|nr:hypothetical protein M9X92_010934 [Pyricularia oryzae]